MMDGIPPSFGSACPLPLPLPLPYPPRSLTFQVLRAGALWRHSQVFLTCTQRQGNGIISRVIQDNALGNEFPI